MADGCCKINVPASMEKRPSTRATAGPSLDTLDVSDCCPDMASNRTRSERSKLTSPLPPSLVQFRWRIGRGVICQLIKCFAASQSSVAIRDHSTLCVDFADMCDAARFESIRSRNEGRTTIVSLPKAANFSGNS